MDRFPPTRPPVLLSRAGDPGYWIVTADTPAIEEPDFPTFTAELSFAHDTPSGLQTIELSAVRGDGAVGPRQVVMLDASARPRTTSSPSSCAGTPTQTWIYTSCCPLAASWR